MQFFYCPHDRPCRGITANTFFALFIFSPFSDFFRTVYYYVFSITQYQSADKCQTANSYKKRPLIKSEIPSWKATPGLEPGIRELQSLALATWLCRRIR